MLHSVTLEFDDADRLRAAVEHLWNKLGFTGELGVEPRGKGGWRLEVIAEREIRAATLEKLGGRVVET